MQVLVSLLKAIRESQPTDKVVLVRWGRGRGAGNWFGLLEAELWKAKPALALQTTLLNSPVPLQQLHREPGAVRQGGGERSEDVPAGNR